MAELPPYRDTGTEPESSTTSATPVWLKVLFGAFLIGLVLVFVGLHLAGVLGPGAH
jgi:hypothetical protein